MTGNLRDAIRAAFDAGCDQGGDEATAHEHGALPQQNRDEAFADFMAEWNPDSAPIRAAMTPTPRSIPMTTDTDALREALDRVNRTLAGTRDDVETFGVADIMALRDAALAAAPQPATPGQRMIRAAEEAVAIARGEAEPASVYPAETDWGPDVGKEVLPPYQSAPDREALVEVIREAIQPSVISDVIPALAADALLARGLRLPGGDETMAWAVADEDGVLRPHTVWASKCCIGPVREGERVVPVAIRIVEDEA